MLQVITSGIYMNTKLIFFSILIYGSVIFQTLYSYFLYVADEEALTDLVGKKNVWMLTTACAILGVFDMLESLSIVNPAEMLYETLNKDSKNVNTIHQDNSAEDNFIVSNEIPPHQIQDETSRLLQISIKTKENFYDRFSKGFLQKYLLKSLTVLGFGSAVMISGVTNALLFGKTIQHNYVRLGFSTAPLLFGTVYLIMLLWDDMQQGHDFIYSRLLSRKSSVLLNIVKSPLVAFELFLTNGFNALLTTILFSYGAIQSKNAFFPEFKENELLNRWIIAVTCFSMTYTTLFSRYISSHELYFNDELRYETFEDTQLSFKRSWLFNAILRSARSVGLAYFVNKYLMRNTIQRTTITSFFATILIAHGIYVSYLRCSNQAKIEVLHKRKASTCSSEQNLVATSNKFLWLSVINAGSKVAYSLAIYAGFNQINTLLKLKLVKLDLIMLTLCFAIPASIIDFDFYRIKMVEAWMYYKNKFEKELEHPRYGLMGSLFRSAKEYTHHSINTTRLPRYDENLEQSNTTATAIGRWCCIFQQTQDYNSVPNKNIQVIEDDYLPDDLNPHEISRSDEGLGKGKTF